MNPLYIEFDTELMDLMESWGLGVVGESIFSGDYPELNEDEDLNYKGFWLVPSPTAAPEKYIDHEYSTIDFYYRSPYTLEGKAKMRELYLKFHQNDHYDTENWHIFSSLAMTRVHDLGRDAEGGKLLRVSIQFIIRNLNSIS